MRTRIIAMITLTSDKFALVKVGFSKDIRSTRDPSGQYQGRYADLGASHPTKRKPKATLAYTVRWDGAMPIRGLCTISCQL
jgi:hypothetical protein